MKQEINPHESSRAEAFSMWMSSPQPMVTLVKTFDVRRLRKVSRKTGVKFTVLLCWCICKAASSIEEFFLLPEPGHLYRFDKLAVNVVVLNEKGGITLCDVPYSDTSALPHTELDCIVNQYSGRWNNPFLVWGKYRKGLFKTTLPISLQFHHAQMDGMQACRFLNNLQYEINQLMR